MLPPLKMNEFVTWKGTILKGKASLPVPFSKICWFSAEETHPLLEKFIQFGSRSTTFFWGGIFPLGKKGVMPEAWVTWGHIPHWPLASMKSYTVHEKHQETPPRGCVRPACCKSWDSLAKLQSFTNRDFPEFFGDFPLLFTTIWGENSCLRSL